MDRAWMTAGAAATLLGTGGNQQGGVRYLVETAPGGSR